MLFFAHIYICACVTTKNTNLEMAAYVYACKKCHAKVEKGVLTYGLADIYAHLRTVHDMKDGETHLLDIRQNEQSAGNVSTHQWVEKCRLKAADLKRLRTADEQSEASTSAQPPKRLKPMDIIDYIRQMDVKFDSIRQMVIDSVKEGVLQALKENAHMSAELLGGAVTTRAASKVNDNSGTNKMQSSEGVEWGHCRRRR